MESLNLQVNQGETFSASFVLSNRDENTGVSTPIDITGWTFRGQIRTKYSTATTVASFTFALPAPTTGAVTFSLTAAETAAIPADAAIDYNKKPTYFAYDIEAVRADLSVIRVLEGTIVLSPEVTR